MADMLLTCSDDIFRIYTLQDIFLTISDVIASQIRSVVTIVEPQTIIFCRALKCSSAQKLKTDVKREPRISVYL